MNKLSILSCVILLIWINHSCISHSAESTISEIDQQRLIDSFKNIQKIKTDSILTAHLIDTTGLSASPIKIIKAELLKGAYTKVVRIKYKNVSNKIIAGIRFKWCGLNAFNEPADLGSSYLLGLGSGFSDDILKAGRSTESDWNVYSKDGKKLVLAWPYEVAFTDNSKWKLKND
jgi:hypothetical protein